LLQVFYHHHQEKGRENSNEFKAIKKHSKPIGNERIKKQNRSPTKRVRFWKEEGANVYGVFTALTQTVEMEWNWLLLTLELLARFELATSSLPSALRGQQ
jgi:hypothetical protein